MHLPGDWEPEVMKVPSSFSYILAPSFGEQDGDLPLSLPETLNEVQLACRSCTGQLHILFRQVKYS